MSKWTTANCGASTTSCDGVWISNTSTTSTNDCGYTQGISTVCQKLYTYFETTNQQLWEPIQTMAWSWIEGLSHLKLIHEPWKFIYVPGRDIEEMLATQNEQMTDLQKKAFATQHLAPIDEAVELEGFTRVMTHLTKLLTDETYRTFQLTEINKINKILGLKECVWSAEAVKGKIAEIKGVWTPKKAWQARGMKHLHQLAEKRAEELFNDVFTPEEIMKLNTDKRLLISRGDLAFELTAEGGINQLLPNGEKQGWCLVSKEYGLTLKDILVMKKLILESAPEIVLEVANKRSPFN